MTTPISIVFDPPTPSDPLAAFDTKAFGLLSSLNTWSTQANAQNVENNALNANVVAQASATASASAVALAAANFKGAWATLTGALNIPASVSHSGSLWILTANTTNVVSDVPGVSAKWQDQGGATGANAIINGRMWNAPDGVTSWTSPATATYMLGLWYFGKVGTGQLNAAQVATGPTHCPTALQFTCTTAQATLASSDLFLVDEILDANTCKQFIGNTFTVRGSIKCDVSGAVPVYIRNNLVNRAYVFPVNVTAGVETPFEHTVVGGLPADGDWGTGVGAGVRYGVCLATGSNYQAPTSEAWLTGTFMGLAGQINAVGAVGRKTAFTNMSMCLGTAKPMADDYATDVRRMRWWYRPSEYFRMSGYTTGSAGNFGSQPFESMRITPSVSIDGNTASNASAASLSAVYTNTVVFSSVGSSVGRYINDISYTLSARY